MLVMYVSKWFALYGRKCYSGSVLSRKLRLVCFFHFHATIHKVCILGLFAILDAQKPHIKRKLIWQDINLYPKISFGYSTVYRVGGCRVNRLTVNFIKDHIPNQFHFEGEAIKTLLKHYWRNKDNPKR